MPDFREDRDRLLELRNDYETADREFRWADAATFNWALDYFDRIARGNERICLHIVDAARFERSLTRASKRS